MRKKGLLETHHLRLLPPLGRYRTSGEGGGATPSWGGGGARGKRVVWRGVYKSGS